METPSSVHSENTGLATWGSSASESATSTLTGKEKSTADAPPTVVLNDFSFKDSEGSFMTAPDVDVVEGKAVKVEQAEVFTQNNVSFCFVLWHVFFSITKCKKILKLILY